MSLVSFVNMIFCLTAWLSMMLINSLVSHASDTRWEEFIAELERLNVRKAVVVSSIPFRTVLKLTMS